jgi:hypothetical protein
MDMRKIIGFIKGVALGVGESTLLPSLVRVVKKVTKSGAISFLDVNGDGKFTMADVKELQWEQIGKLAAVGVILYLSAKFGISF